MLLYKGAVPDGDAWVYPTSSGVNCELQLREKPENSEISFLVPAPRQIRAAPEKPWGIPDPCQKQNRGGRQIGQRHPGRHSKPLLRGPQGRGVLSQHSGRGGQRIIGMSSASGWTGMPSRRAPASSSPLKCAGKSSRTTRSIPSCRIWSTRISRKLFGHWPKARTRGHRAADDPLKSSPNPSDSAPPR